MRLVQFLVPCGKFPVLRHALQFLIATNPWSEGSRRDWDNALRFALHTARQLKHIVDYPGVKIDIVIIGQGWVQNQVRFFELKNQLKLSCQKIY